MFFGGYFNSSEIQRQNGMNIGWWLNHLVDGNTQDDYVQWLEPSIWKGWKYSLDIQHQFVKLDDQFVGGLNGKYILVKIGLDVFSVSQILGICLFSPRNHHLDDLGKTEQSQQKYLQSAGFPNVSVMSPFVCPSYASREVNSNCGTLSRPQMIDISTVGKIRKIQHPTSNNKQPNQPS